MRLPSRNSCYDSFDESSTDRPGTARLQELRDTGAELRPALSEVWASILGRRPAPPASGRATREALITLPGSLAHFVLFRLARPFRRAPLLRTAPVLRGWLWKRFYDAAATRIADEKFTFLNLGFLDPAGPELARSDLDDAGITEQLSERLYERVLGDIDVAGHTVLEVGCGRGGGCAYLARAHQPAHVIGLDASAKLIDWCADNYRLSGLRFQLGDAATLPVPAASIDTVVNVESSHCYPSRLDFFREVSRVLKPGGYFSFADLLFPNREAATPAEIEALLVRADLIAAQGSEITAGVVAARKAVSHSSAFRARLPTVVPRWAAKMAWEGYCLEGSAHYDGMVAGELRYWCWAARKPGW